MTVNTVLSFLVIGLWMRHLMISGNPIFFPQHINTLSIFRQCTVHISNQMFIKPNRHFSLQATFLEMCILRKGCPTVLTLQLHKNTSWNSFSMKFQEYQKLHSIHTKIFMRWKFQHRCRVSLPFLVRAGSKLGMSVDDLLWFTGTYKYNNSATLRHFTTSEIDYLLLPNYESIYKNSPNLISTHPRSPFKMLLFSSTRGTVTIACAVCRTGRMKIQRLTLGIVFRIDVYHIRIPPAKLTTLEYIDSLWYELHSNRNHRTYNIFEANKRVGYFWKGQLASNDYGFPDGLIVSYFNITYLEVLHSRPGSIIILKESRSYWENFHFSTHGYVPNHHNYKYFIIMKKDNLETWRLTRVPVLLKPFQNNVWLMLLLSASMLSIFIQTSDSIEGILPTFVNSYFWSIRNLLEQSHCINHKQFRVLACIWLVSGICFRNGYTFSMYAEITNSPKPVMLPKSFMQLVQTSNILKLIVPYCTYNQVDHMSGKLAEFKNILLKNAYRASLRGKQMKKLFNRGDLDITRFHNYSGSDSYDSQLKPEDNFAVISQSPMCAGNTLKLVFAMFDSVAVYDSEGPAALAYPSFMGWRFQTFFTPFYLRSRSWLIQGGIDGYRSLVRTIRKRFYYLKPVFVRVGLTTNVFSVAHRFTSLEFRRTSYDAKTTSHHLLTKHGLNSQGNCKLKDLMAVWLMLVYLLLFSGTIFVIEICNRLFVWVWIWNCTSLRSFI